jgi:hypothetical protein
MIRRLIASLVERYRNWSDDRAMKRWSAWQDKDLDKRFREIDPLP